MQERRKIFRCGVGDSQSIVGLGIDSVNIKNCVQGIITASPENLIVKGFYGSLSHLSRPIVPFYALPLK